MLKIEVEPNNAAFADDPEGELARILRDIAKRIENGESQGTVRDLNGNAVGWFERG